MPRGTLPQLKVPPQVFDLASLAASQPASPVPEAVLAGLESAKNDIATGVEGIVEDAPYETAGKRVVGVPEGFLRSLGRQGVEFADMASRLTPSGVAEHITAAAAGQPTQNERVAEGLALNPETETYAGARAETAAELPASLIANFAPVERLAKAPAFLKSLFQTREAKEAALAGELGPAAQGAATGEEIVQQAAEAAPKPAGELSIGPQERMPAKVVAPQEAVGEARAPSAAPTPEVVRPELSEAAPVRAEPAAPLPEAGVRVEKPAIPPESLTPDEHLAAEPRPAEPTVFDLSPSEATKRATVGDSAVTYTAGPDSAHIVLVQTPTKARGQGSARAAMEQMTTAADAQGKRLTLNVSPIDSRVDEGRLTGFYESLGFKRSGTTKNGDLHMERVPAAAPSRAVTENERLRSSLGLPPKETPHASQVRSDTGQIRVEGNAGRRSEDAGSQNLQRHPETGQPLPEQPRVAGEEGRNLEAPQIAPREQTGIANAHVAAERAERGLEEVKHDLSRTDPQGWERAAQRIEADPNHGRDLAASLAKTPRPASKEEVFTLIQDRVRIKNERSAAYDEAIRAQESGQAEAVATARQKIARLDDEMELNDYAARVTGHESAEGLRARQRLAADDYSMAELVRRARVRKGEQLTAEETTRLEKLSKDIEAREAAVARREAELASSKAKPKNPIARKESQRRFDALAEELKSLPRATLCELA